MATDEIRAAIKEAMAATQDLDEPFKSIAFRVVLERCLESQASAVRTPGRSQVRVDETFPEFVAARQPTTHVSRVVSRAYHALHVGDRTGITVRDIEEAYRQIRERKPQNIPDVIAQCSRRGFLVEGERKDGAKAWVITSRGEAYVESGFELPRQKA